MFAPYFEEHLTYVGNWYPTYTEKDLVPDARRPPVGQDALVKRA